MKGDDLYKMISSPDDHAEEMSVVTDSQIAFGTDLADDALRMAKIGKAKEELAGLKQDREQRKIFAKWIFGFTCAYVFCILLMVCLCGFGCMHLSDSVLITMLTTTFAEVIGVLTFVAKYLFHT